MARRILAAVDAEHPESWTEVVAALRALAPAAERLDVVYVLPEIGSALVGAALPEGFEAGEIEAAVARLRALVGRGPVAPLPAPIPHVAHGAVDEAILAAVERLGSDLLALRAPRHGVEARLLGSHAEALARATPCSVLLVRPPGG